MFRKEALKHQYKSQNFGHSVIRQPSFINKAIFFLFVIIFISIISLQFITISTQQSYPIKISSENYLPIVFSNSIVINKQLISDGIQVNKNQPLINIRIINDIDKHKKNQLLTAPRAGLYFHSNIDSNIIPPYQPIGFLLEYNLANEFIFWLKEKPENDINVGDNVKIQYVKNTISGRISMIFGEYVKNKGLKISIKLKDKQLLSLLSPQSSPTLSLSKQPKKFAQLLR